MAAENCREILKELVDEIWKNEPVEDSGAVTPGSGPWLGGASTQYPEVEDDVFNELGTEPEYQKPVGNEVLVGFDAVALFPSIEKNLAVEICREVLLETEIKFIDTNLLEAT